MLRRIWNSIFKVDVYDSALDRSRATMIYAIMVVVLIAYTLYALAIRQWGGDGSLTLFGLILRGDEFGTSLLFLSLYVLCGVTFFATRNGNLETGSWLLIAVWYLPGVLLNLTAQDTLEAMGLPLAILVVLGALLERQAGLYLTTPVAVVTLFGGWILRGSVEPLADMVLVSMNLIAFAVVLWLFLRYFRLTLSTSVSEALEERLVINEISTWATQLIVRRVPSNQLMFEIAKKLTERFGSVKAARIYIINENNPEVQLVADDQRMTIPEDEQLVYGIGGLSSIGQVTFQGRPVVTPRENQRLVDVTLALKADDRIIGAIELMGEPIIGSQQFVESLQSLANNLALAIDSARQNERTEQRLKDSEAVLEQVRNNLRDYERLNQRLTSSVWSQYLQTADENMGISVDFEANVLQPESQWTNTLTEAFRINHLVQEQRENAQVIALPLRVRGQVIGAMEFEIDTERGFTPEDLELLQEVGERFGLAAENTRLLEDSRRIAQREALVNQITARLQTSTTVNSTLLEAARGLREAMKAHKVAIRLGTPSTEPSKGEDV